MLSFGAKSCNWSFPLRKEDETDHDNEKWSIPELERTERACLQRWGNSGSWVTRLGGVEKTPRVYIQSVSFKAVIWVSRNARLK